MRKKLTRKEVIEMKFERIDKEITDILEKKSEGTTFRTNKSQHSKVLSRATQSPSRSSLYSRQRSLNAFTPKERIRPSLATIVQKSQKDSHATLQNDSFYSEFVTPKIIRSSIKRIKKPIYITQ